MTLTRAMNLTSAYVLNTAVYRQNAFSFYFTVFRFVIIIVLNYYLFLFFYFFAFRHQISDIALTRAMNLMSAYVRNAGVPPKLRQRFVDIRGGRARHRFLLPCKSQHSLLQRGSSWANIVRCIC